MIDQPMARSMLTRRSTRALLLLVLTAAGLVLGAASARADTQASVNVGVIPGPFHHGIGACGGFTAPVYHPEDGLGIPQFLPEWFGCGSYTFSGVGSVSGSGRSLQIVGITPDALAGLDTLILYGVRWDSLHDPNPLTPDEQQTINTFARTHKVIIWDADSTTTKPVGSSFDGQDYRSYDVPFTTIASGGQKTVGYTAAATRGDPLTTTPNLIDGGLLAGQPHAIGDMTAQLQQDPTVWHDAVTGGNKTLDQFAGPQTYPVVAWALGDQAAYSGLTIYSGLDADALGKTVTGGTDWAMLELSNQLAAPWCSVNCAPVQHRLSVTVSGSGTVTSAPAGITCPSTCSAPFDPVNVSLTPVAAPGWIFSGWSNDCTGAGSCSVNMASDHDVTATFTAIPPSKFGLSVSVTGNGSVTSSPGGLSCSDACSALFNAGSAVSLNVVAAAGWHLVGFSGACSGTTCSVAGQAGQSLAVTVTLAANSQGAGNGVSPTCSVVPVTRWVRRIVALRVRASVSPASVALMAGATRQLSLLHPSGLSFAVPVDTRRLPTNATTTLTVRLRDTSGHVVCAASVRLHVDNTAPRARRLAVRRHGPAVQVAFTPSEPITARITPRGGKTVTRRLPTTRPFQLRLTTRASIVRLVLVDRAGNTRTVIAHVS
jgi:uncharacterized repeat protein (TIGR02543 family)